MTPETKYLTRCRICGHEFKNSPFVPYVGNGIDPRLIAMQQKLGEHMLSDEKHQFYSATALAVACFAFQDPVINDFLNLVRFSLQQASRRNIATDSQILDRFAALGFGSESIEILKPLVYDLRDFLMEQGAHAPKIEEPSALVTG